MKARTAHRFFVASLVANSLFLCLWLISTVTPCSLRLGNCRFSMLTGGHFWYSWFSGPSTSLDQIQSELVAGGVLQRTGYINPSDDKLKPWSCDFGSSKPSGPGGIPLTRQDVILPLLPPTLLLFVVNGLIIKRKLANRRLELIRTSVCVNC
ncbi:MAG TPA: hypothetical protein P5081_05695 [Phycisphaerae bacterium]|nr:hypothetical protein [Phycisphaerae bacterium]HRW52359.1 hypothetical protein [Phycisphaerae bacterium]